MKSVIFGGVYTGSFYEISPFVYTSVFFCDETLKIIVLYFFYLTKLTNWH